MITQLVDSVVSVSTDDLNNPVWLARQKMMRGGIGGSCIVDCYNNRVYCRVALIEASLYHNNIALYVVELPNEHGSIQMTCD